MHIANWDATQALLPYVELANELSSVIRDAQAVAPPRLIMPLSADGALLAMPATDGTLAITKLVTVHPHNRARGLPSVQGEVIVMDARTGQRLALLDGQAVTARRTAALSLLAAQHLASPQAQRGPLLIMGAGVQGKAHLEAFTQWLPRCDVFICARTFDSAEALAHAARQQGVNAQAVGTAADILPACGLIITATTSRQPLFDDRVHDDVFIAAVGAYTPQMAELPADLVRRASLFVDTLEGAQSEAGDLIQAGVDWSQVTPLSAVLAGAKPTPGRPVIFKSVGHALWDLAAARLAIRTLAEKERPSETRSALGTPKVG
jgi:1-piperideine-2-carboxylate/1-pyrroline-2-carboxylate reductase [NAD(P)H]